MRYILFIVIILLNVGCTNSTSKDTSDLDAYIAALDDKSIAEIKEEINSTIDQFEQFVNFSFF